MIDEIVPFGETNFRNRRTRFGIKTDDRRRHMYVVGKTGMGKTNMIQNMVISDIWSGKGLAVVDPHGEFAETILEYVPEERIKDVIYFNPADINYPIAFNVIENVSPEYRHLITDGLIAIFQKLWATSWGPRLEYVLRNTILALLEVPDSTLLGIMRMLVDKPYRKWVIGQLKDPVIRAFWVEEFSKYPDRFATEAVAPIQNKVGQFLANPLIRNIVGQPNTSFDIRASMDEGKIFIVNLSKGRIGEGTSRLLGAMMITKFQLAAMSRIDTPEKERRDFYLYVDEFQNFATEAFAGILSEARKYRLNLILAHQYIAQLEDGASTVVKDAVFGNVGTMVTFRVGASDAEFLEKEFEPEFMVNDLVNLAKFHIYLKLMIDGVSSRAFSAVALPPLDKPEISYKQEIIDYSRSEYGVAREEVEKSIAEWAGPIESAEGSEAAGVGGGKTAKRDLYTTECSVCKKEVQVPFLPDGVRPVYCDEHHAQIQAGTLDPVKPARRPSAESARRASAPKSSPSSAQGLKDNRDGTEAEGKKPEKKKYDNAQMKQPEIRDVGIVTRDAAEESISLDSLPSRADVVADTPSSNEAIEEIPSPSSGEPIKESHTVPLRRKRIKKEKKERPDPDLSGLRDILEEVLDDGDNDQDEDNQDDGVEKDLDKRVEEESVNDILGR